MRIQIYSQQAQLSGGVPVTFDLSTYTAKTGQLTDSGQLSKIFFIIIIICCTPQERCNKTDTKR